LASATIFLHSQHSLTIACLFFIPITFNPLHLRPSIHFVDFLVPSTLVVAFLCVLTFVKLLLGISDYQGFCVDHKLVYNHLLILNCFIITLYLSCSIYD
jgi:hypothetical protein